MSFATLTAAASCPKQQMPSGKMSTFRIKGFDAIGKTRTYHVYVPSTYDNSKAVPLHVTFHGLNAPCVLPGGTYWNLKGEAEKRGYILAAPCGSLGDGGLGPHGWLPVSMGNAWNAGTCCGFKANSATDDFAFTRTVVEQVSEKLCIDSDKIWSSGFSNGAMMAEVLACKMNDVFRATASVSGVVELQPGNEGGLKTCDTAVTNSTKRTSVLNVHGDLDPLVPWQSDPFAGFPSIPADFSAWGKRSGCKTGPPQVFQKGKYTIQRLSDCTDGSQFDVVRNHGGSHEWPSDKDFDTTNYLHEFFNNVSGIEYQPEAWSPSNKEDLPVSHWHTGDELPARPASTPSLVV